MVAPTILVSNVEIPQEFLKDTHLNDFIYSSAELFDNTYFSLINGLGVKIIDTYNNGAISININRDNEL